MGLPTTIPREHRLEAANQLTTLLHQKYGDDLLAVGIYGSVARSQDGPFSDLEMVAIVKGEGIDVTHEAITSGLKWEVDIVSRDVANNELTELNLGWSQMAGIYLDVQPLYDPSQIFDSFKKTYQQVIAQDFTHAIKDVFIADIYEQCCKFFNLAEQPNARLSFLANHLFVKMIGFVGLINKAHYGSTSTRAQQAMDLPLNFASFQKLGGKVAQGNLQDSQELKRIVQTMYLEVEKYVLSLGIDIESPVLRLDD